MLLTVVSLLCQSEPLLSGLRADRALERAPLVVRIAHRFLQSGGAISLIVTRCDRCLSSALLFDSRLPADPMHLPYQKQ